uniref:Uncharacterized protein n=1 Tax=Caenorhabditis japonica TaxID=281687 RepID=A0A8R1IAC0_CAEJA
MEYGPNAPSLSPQRETQHCSFAATRNNTSHSPQRENITVQALISVLVGIDFYSNTRSLLYQAIIILAAWPRIICLLLCRNLFRNSTNFERRTIIMQKPTWKLG